MSKNLFIGAVLLVATAAPGQYSNTTSVLDGSGGQSAGGGYTNLSAAGQSCGIFVSSGGGFVNHAGFFNTFFMKPGIDTDHDGLPDEADRDNDGDGLDDDLEITGGSFSPATPTLVNVADTDGDGTPDGPEATAGTDPDDSGTSLRITSIRNIAGQRQVAWIAHGNHERTYRVLTATDVRAPFNDVIYSNTVAGGIYPWYVVTNIIGHAAATNALFYRIDVRP